MYFIFTKSNVQFQHFSSKYVLFWSPWKHQKTKGFLMFSGGSKENIVKRWANQTNITASAHYLRLKSVQIRSFFWSEYEKIRTTKNSVFGHISCSDYLCLKTLFEVWDRVFPLKIINTNLVPYRFPTWTCHIHYWKVRDCSLIFKKTSGRGKSVNAPPDLFVFLPDV